MRIMQIMITMIVLVALTRSSQAGAAGFLVTAQSGGLPIIITAPHGGSWSIPGITARTTGKILKDEFTLELAEALANHLHKLLGTRPYLVAAQFNRKFIDANRMESAAFSAQKAKPYYDEYHRLIREFVAEIRKKYPGGAILIDIHGQSSDNSAVYRGTRNGSTVDNLFNRYGCNSLTGEQSISGVLAARGYRIIPANRSTDCLSEEAKYVGGYTVARYGSNNSDGIDAIQLEVGRDLRKSPAFAEDLAKAVSVFYENFLVVRK